MANRFLLLFLCSSLAFAQAARDRMVIVISLDGFPAYYLADPKLPAPTLRQLIANGSWAEAMKPINPTWTWPNHTTLVTGLKASEHGLLYNGELIRQDDPLSVRIDPSIAKTQMVHCPTLYDVAFKAGLTTAQVDWVAINDAPTITWAFPEKASISDPLVKEMIANHAIEASDVGGKAEIVWRDQIWTKAGVYLIQKHHPNLLLFHLLTLDSTQHQYGPKTLAAADAVAFLDSCVRKLVDAAKDAGMMDRTTFFVVSDHGFRAVHKHILLKNLLTETKLGPDVTGIAEGGSAMIYVAKKNRAQALAQVKAVLDKTEGIERVEGEAEYPALGFPLPSQDSQMPDLVAIAKPDYAFSGASENGSEVVISSPNTTGSHGYPNTDPEMQAIFIANGFGIRPHVQLERIDNIAVAPTLAKLLGIQLPKVEEPPIGRILQ